MEIQKLKDTVQALMAEGKGLLAMDESTPTSDKRFKVVGIPQTEEMRRIYREWIATAPGLGESISGAILYDETIRQKTDDGIPFVEVLHKAGIVPGIKVDEGAHDLAGFPDEKVTDGLDGLRDRLKEYAAMGARFAKWRAVITIGEGIPTSTCIEANTEALARYAALCQEAGIVPIVEPETLMDGDHTLEQCEAVTERVLRSLFTRLALHKVALEGILLKPNMVLPGEKCPTQNSVEEVADATVNCFNRTVPAAIGGIAFLSGGQSAELASARLNAMHVRHKDLPWPLTFSFSRAIQQPALELWAGKPENVEKAQQVLVRRAKCNSAARLGQYTEAMEG
ncbi:fructose-bisphosphate aldolase class 1 [Abditibacteriota bacterium]|nr:fructose-bisphosphate aldolase class 1 [Abditibacteriota bacterium]